MKLTVGAWAWTKNRPVMDTKSLMLPKSEVMSIVAPPRVTAPFWLAVPPVIVSSPLTFPGFRFSMSLVVEPLPYRSRSRVRLEGQAVAVIDIDHIVVGGIDLDEIDAARRELAGGVAVELKVQQRRVGGITIERQNAGIGLGARIEGDVQGTAPPG